MLSSAPMRSNEIFARMTPERAGDFLAELRREAKPVARMALTAATDAFRLRPQFLAKQPRAKQAEWVRKALARPALASTAEEVLAEYFLGHRKELLIEWLDCAGIAHADGLLDDASPACPAPDELRGAVEAFCAGENPERRRLLLAAFAAQSAVEWPDLEALLAGD